MSKYILTALLFIALNSNAQVVKDYNPSIQRTTHMQYFKPIEEHLFTGDCMPYYHNGTFYVYWLLDEGHHAGLGGLGGHQWALSTTTDLIHWKHHPVALGIDQEWEKSICTGSVIAEKDKFYAFYATRVKENEVLPAMSAASKPSIKSLSDKTVVISNEMIRMNASGDIGVAFLSDIPENYRISMDISPEGNYEELGLFFRATDARTFRFRK